MDLSHITINFIKKDFGIKGEDNMEVNFIEMMKDSAENGTVYRRIAPSGVMPRQYKVINGVLTYKNMMQNFETIDIVSIELAKSMFVKVEQYKEITAEEALKALREDKEVEWEYKGFPRKIMDMWSYSIGVFLNKDSKFYIKE